ncbi:MAG: KilA-N domain-containing protein [Polaribacter sp.]
MAKTKQIKVQGVVINLSIAKASDYICITDMANAKDGTGRAADIIKNWIRTRATLEFLGTWEQLYNLDFKVVEFDHFKIK